MLHKPIFETELSPELGKAKVYQDDAGLWVTVGRGWMAVRAEPDKNGNPQFLIVTEFVPDPRIPSVQHPEAKSFCLENH